MRVEKKLLAASVAALLAAPAPVWAGELEDLKAQMLQMMKRIEQLEAQQAAVPKASGGGGKPAVTAGTDKVRVSLSGHINRAVLAYDDGVNSDVHHVDNENSNTRFRIVGEYDASDSMTVGTVMEVEFESNSSSDVAQNSNSTDQSERSFQERKFEVYFAGDSWGKLSLGQGDTASNDTSEVDLSGTALAGYAGVAFVGGSLKFVDKATGLLSGVEVGDAFTNMDGLSRQDRIRYDTPAFGGFVLSVSHAEDDGADAALTYSADYDGTKVAAALAYADNQSSNSAGVDNQVNGSISVLMPGGFNLTFAAGEQDLKAAVSDDPSFYYTKLGYRMGMSAYSVDYYSSDDVNTVGDEAESYGFQYVRTIPQWATEAYFQVRQFELDSVGVEYDDILTVMTGARVKF